MKVDMSPHAITMRIKKTSQLRRLCISLGGERLKKKLEKMNSTAIVLKAASTHRSVAK